MRSSQFACGKRLAVQDNIHGFDEALLGELTI